VAHALTTNLRSASSSFRSKPQHSTTREDKLVTTSKQEFVHEIRIDRVMRERPGRGEPLPVEAEERRAKLAAFEAMFGPR